MSEVLFQLTVEDVEKYAGRTLTEDEKARFARAFPYTTVFECVAGCLDGLGIT